MPLHGRTYSGFASLDVFGDSSVPPLPITKLCFPFNFGSDEEEVESFAGDVFGLFCKLLSVTTLLEVLKSLVLVLRCLAGTG